MNDSPPALSSKLTSATPICWRQGHVDLQPTTGPQAKPEMNAARLLSVSLLPATLMPLTHRSQPASMLRALTALGTLNKEESAVKKTVRHTGRCFQSIHLRHSPRRKSGSWQRRSAALAADRRQCWGQRPLHGVVRGKGLGVASIVVVEGTGEAQAPSNLRLHSLSSRGKSTCCVGMKGEVN